MGLDGADIMIELEDRFGIRIDDDEAIYLYLTPARIEWLVLEKLSGRQPAIVDWQRLLEWLTQTLKRLPGRRRLWTSTMSLNRAFPCRLRTSLWNEFGRELGVRLPSLELPDSDCPRIPYQVGDCWKLAVWMLDHYPDRCPRAREGSSIEPLGTGQWRDERVSAEVIDVLCHCLGLTHDRITPDALLNDELGMD